MAKRLNISISQTVEAIKRLERLNFLKKNEDGTFVNCKKQLSTTDGTPDISLRKAHSHNLMLAQKSLEHDDLSTRDFTAVTMALDPEKLNDAKKMIREFRDKLSLYLSSGKKKEVYKLCVQLFPLTRK
ncbi:MAG: DUF4423 domain-containing protein [Deltaproteobacteria bacterium]|nr:DUF4423 domain-containing protein [Deltaproteobacteria bacterium]